MSKNNTVVLRTPGASNSKDKMVNAGVGFIDTVNLERGEKRTVVHFLPEQPLTKGKTIMVFPYRGHELPDGQKNDTFSTIPQGFADGSGCVISPVLFFVARSL
jgi:hypothetical protein